MYKPIDYHRLPRRDLLCIDAKSFFASVEAVRRGLHPLEAYLIVISDFDRPGAVVLAASPKVKAEFGISTGSRKFQIPRDPRLIITEPSMGLYLEKNRAICSIFRRYVAEEDLLIYSIDEAFLDVSSTRRLFGPPQEIATRIQREVLEELGLVLAVGMGDNPLLAKLALDNEAKKRPCQTACWSYEDVPRTIWKIPKLTDMWGISRGYEATLRSLGIRSVYDLAHANPHLLKSRMGILGLQLYYHSHGVDYSRLSERVPAKNKSYGKGQILMRDYHKKEEILFIVREMTEEVAARLRKRGMHCSKIGLFVGYSQREGRERGSASGGSGGGSSGSGSASGSDNGSGCDNGSLGGFSKDFTLPRPTNETRELSAFFGRLFETHWDPSRPVRQIYVSCNQVHRAEYLQLDFLTMLEDQKGRQLDRVLDQIRASYGKTSIFKGYHLLDGSTFLDRAGYIGGHKGGGNQL